MFQRNISRKILSLLIISILVFSGILVFFTTVPIIPQASALTEWKHTSDTDFNSGTLKNLSVSGSGSGAELKLTYQPLRWYNAQPPLKPPERTVHGTAYVWGTDQVVLFGGKDNSNNQMNDTWIYDYGDNTWTKVHTTPSPGKREAHELVTLQNTDNVMLFGGYEKSSASWLNETWIFDLSDKTWTKKTPNGVIPDGRSRFASSSITGTTCAMIFGGADSYDETWIYNVTNNTWIDNKASTSHTLLSRHDFAMASIPNDDKVIMFGGTRQNNFLGDTWVFDLSDNYWSKQTPSSAPNARDSHDMGSIYGKDQIMFFGGYTHSSLYKDTWIFDISTSNWNELSPSSKPPSLEDTSVVYIWGTDKLCLFGGRDGSKNINETWIFSDEGFDKGSFTSPVRDAGPNSLFKTLSWTSAAPPDTSVTIQIRSAENISVLSTRDFVGPDGTKSSFYSSSPAAIWSGHEKDRYLQYRVYLKTTNASRTPSLQDVSITYNQLPKATLLGPFDNTMLSDNNPTFTWSFSDPDSTQANFQLVVDNESTFTDIDYDSGVQSSSNHEWQFPSALSDGLWYWKVRAMDSDGEWSEYSPIWKFTIDTKSPISIPMLPEDGNFYIQLDLISGTASDTPSGTGIKEVEILIKEANEDLFWSGLSWTSTEIWLITSGTTEWLFDSSSVDWASGTQYAVKSHAIDNADNLEIPGVGNSFTMDSASPVTSVEHPYHESSINSLDKIIGTAFDIDGSQVKTVELSIKRTSDSKYWTGSDWASGSRYWLTAAGTNNWIYDASEVDWVTDINYNIQSRALDYAGNVELVGDGITFMYDNLAPNIKSFMINGYDMYTNSRDVKVTSDCTDSGSGIASMKSSFDDVTWSEWEEYQSEQSIILPEGEGEKTLYCKIIDRADNIASTFDEIILDTTPPEVVSIIINDRDIYTNQELVNITLEATDSLSGIDQMSFSFNKIDWTPWSSLLSKTQLTLPSGDGGKIIYFRVSDKAGNLAITSDTIILDTTPPHSNSMVINGGAEETNSTSALIDITAKDDLSGVHQMAFRNDDGLWSDWENFTETKKYELLTVDGQKTVYVRIKDRAGNIALPASATIILNTTKETQIDDDDDDGTDKDERAADEKEGETNYLLILLIVIIVVIIALFFALYLRDSRKRRALEEKVAAMEGTQISQKAADALPAPSQTPPIRLRGTTVQDAVISGETHARPIPSTPVQPSAQIQQLPTPGPSQIAQPHYGEGPVSGYASAPAPTQPAGPMTTPPSIQPAPKLPPPQEDITVDYIPPEGTSKSQTQKPK